MKVYAPRYRKPEDEGWVVVMGSPYIRELSALGAVMGSTTFSLVLSPMEVCMIFSPPC